MTDNDWDYIFQQRFLDETTRVKGVRILKSFMKESKLYGRAIEVVFV